MIYLFTDFGSSDIYVGQVKARLARVAPGVPIIDLTHDAPTFHVEASAHLLCALLMGEQLRGCVTLAVVDPGVGTSRRPVAIRTGGAWFVGPDNGLLSVLAARAEDAVIHEIVWRPHSMSRSFHGRDLFAPIAGWIAVSGFPEASMAVPAGGLEVAFGAADLGAVIYIDHYGNALTGLRSGGSDVARSLRIRGVAVPFASVFAEASPHQPFWYVNSIGLVEVAVNRGSAARELRLRVGDACGWVE